MRQTVYTCLVATMVATMGTEAQALQLSVDRDSGDLALTNDAASTINIAAYAVLSSSGGLRPANWLSIADNYDSNNGGEVDPDDRWFELASSTVELAEATAGSANLTPSQTVDLGSGAWNPDSPLDLVFVYVNGAADEVEQGTIRYFSDELASDFNMDGRVNGDDFLIWQANFGMRFGATLELGDTDGDGDVDGDDFLRWQAEFGSAGGGAGVIAASSVPEPASVTLFALFLVASPLFAARVHACGVAFRRCPRGSDRASARPTPHS